MNDLIIIGAGPAGLSAGLFAGLYGLKTKIIGETIGGEVKLAPMIFDYPGVKAIKGSDWLSTMLEQIKASGAQLLEARVNVVARTGSVQSPPQYTAQVPGEQIGAQALIFATGSKKRRPSYTGAELARSLGIRLTSEDLLDVDQSLATNLPGVFAAGNCLEQPLGIEQLVDAAAQGTRAAAQVYEFLKGTKAPILWGKASIPNP